MTGITELRDRSVLASCLPGFLGDPGIALPAAKLRVSGVSGMRKPGFALCGLAGERPAQAPAAAVAQAYAFASAGANGAETRAGWAAFFTARHAAAVTQQYHAMRAFRGLEPWRDPS